MAVNKEDILNAVAAMSVMDVVELIKMMEEKFGVSAAAAVAVAAPAAASGEAAEEKTEFNVHMVKTGEKKIEVIKARLLKEANENKDAFGRDVKEMRLLFWKCMLAAFLVMCVFYKGGITHWF